ncbi:MAG: UvrD-helicase domain-containing protein [Desulfamplus sp.]|nr:UvrD-helicase domain-containing protein [Desulfamplus sp.]
MAKNKEPDMSSHILNPLTFPLHGTRLIEASAGTGKTYTIAALYLRLVLGHGGQNSFSRPLAPPEILVVTFTNAATEELRDRIRKRLTQAADFFRQHDTDKTEENGIRDDVKADDIKADIKADVDEFLTNLRDDYSPQTWETNARLLDQAAQWMDEAAIHTIHSWCQRMLRQHAFDSGSLFDLKLSVNQEKLYEEAACDYWRSQFYNRSVEEISELKSMVSISTPQNLLKEAMPFIHSRPESSSGSSGMLSVSFEKYPGSFSRSPDFFEKLPDPFDVLRERRALIEASRSVWESDFDNAINLVQDARADKTLNGNKYRQTSLEKWIEELESWVKYKGDLPGAKVIGKFSRSGLEEGLNNKKNKTAPEHRAFDSFALLLEKFDQNYWFAFSQKSKEGKEGETFANFKFLVYSHAAMDIAERVNRVKERLAIMGFDDMITRMDKAVGRRANQRLAQVIANQYPVAMIDEFQDTDSVQYRIFSRIYLTRPAKEFSGSAMAGMDLAEKESSGMDLAEKESSGMELAGKESSGRGFFMIGDPKQAIYAFRGADIYTYLAARRDCENNLYTLEKNFRSSTGMVEAANRMFGFASDEATHPCGPFLFKDKIPFEPVAAQGRGEVLVVREAEPESTETRFQVHESKDVISGITLCHLNQSYPLNKTGNDGYIELMAQSFADKIVHLLNLGAQNPPQAGFVINNRSRGKEDNFAKESDIDRDACMPEGRKEKIEHRISSEINGLRPSDMAILVRDFREADAIRSALSMRNVRTVYLSDNDSVFESKEASSLLYILRACSEPSNDAFIRSALASSIVALPLTLLDELNHDEIAWEREVERFRGYLSMWHNQGVLPMIRAFLFDFGIPSRLLSRPYGERQLTNLLHLSEILQSAASSLDGEQALIRWFAKELKDQSVSEESDDRILRLESDDELVRVVTIHKSKGLEYPLVFLPFICTFREITGLNKVTRYHDDQGELHVVANPEKADLEAADRERLAEDTRMLYVAVTRSIHACWIGVGVMGSVSVKEGEKSKLHLSALGHLLAGGNPGENMIPASELPEKLKQLKGDCSHIDIEIMPLTLERKPEMYDHKESEPEPGSARHFNGNIPRHWWITSYSAMLAGAKMPSDKVTSEDRLIVNSPDSPALDQLQEYASEAWASPEINPSDRTIHTFPRGPEPGTFLHDLMEWAATEGFDRLTSERHYLLSKVKSLCTRRGRDDWAEFLAQWLHALIQTPLQLSSITEKNHPHLPLSSMTDKNHPHLPLSSMPDMPDLHEASVDSELTSKADTEINAKSRTITLAGLSCEDCQAEMEFMFATHKVETRVLDQAIHKAVLPGIARPQLEPNRLNGMLKGFIDLVFCHDGQYFVMDYKSNYLGQRQKDYSQNAMTKAMLEHRYDLQYVLYTLALHRLLKSRLGDRYDYDRDVGGVIYLFLRGVNLRDMTSEGHGVYFDKPPFELIDMLDNCFAGKGDCHVCG